LAIAGDRGLTLAGADEFAARRREYMTMDRRGLSLHLRDAGRAVSGLAVSRCACQ
jgi:hypothetical protein